MYYQMTLEGKFRVWTNGPEIRDILQKYKDYKNVGLTHRSLSPHQFVQAEIDGQYGSRILLGSNIDPSEKAKMMRDLAIYDWKEGQTMIDCLTLRNPKADDRSIDGESLPNDFLWVAAQLGVPLSPESYKEVEFFRKIHQSEIGEYLSSGKFRYGMKSKKKVEKVGPILPKKDIDIAGDMEKDINNSSHDALEFNGLGA